MVFIHTPNCGGEFVSKAFGNAFADCVTMTDHRMKDHQTWRNCRVGLSRHALDIKDFHTFALVRNPWHWHQSWYHNVKQDIGGKRSGMPVEHALFQNISFIEYLRWLSNPGITGLQNRYYLRQMSDWLIDGNGIIAVDHVLHCETLGDDLQKLSDFYGLHLQSPSKGNDHLHSDRHPDIAYCTEGVEIVRKRHARDIALFGYSFDDHAAKETAFG